MVSDRGRYCKSGVLSFKRMRVNLPVFGSLDSSQMPAQLVHLSVQRTAEDCMCVCLQCQAWRPQHFNTGQ